MNYDDKRSGICREVTWLVALDLDYCANEYGQAPCGASGGEGCYYTYSTCLAPADFSRTMKEYCFCSADGPRLPGALPYLASVGEVPTEIKPGESVTRRARVTIEFLDDEPLALANPDKAVSRLETGGSYFRNLIARNPNLEGRTARVYRGFGGLEVSEYRLVFKGVIDGLEWEEGRARLIVKDQLKLLDKKIPPRQSSKNVLLMDYSGGSVMHVADGAEFEAPGAVKIEDEYVTFTGVTAQTLEGCSSGAYGSAAASHLAGTKVAQAAVFAEEDSGEGLPADEIFMSLLCESGGIDPLDLAAVDRGVTLSSSIGASELEIGLNNARDLPETGTVRIGDELVSYRGKTSSGVHATERGALGSEAASHGQDEAAPVVVFSDELGRWLSGSLFRRRVDKPTSIKKLINGLREQTMLHVWQGEDSKIWAKCVAPPVMAGNAAELDDETGFIDGSTSWEPGLKLQATRATVYYDPMAGASGDEADSYAGLLVYIDAESESNDFFRLSKNKEIKADWIYRENEALILASRYLIRYGRGAPTLGFSLELKDSGLKVGDFVRVTSRDVVDASGAPLAGRLFEVLKKSARSDNRFEYAAIDTNLSRRYPLISPAEVGHDYSSASVEERERHGWIGDWDNKVGPDGEDGYHVY